jgi:hypothetical protein
VQPRDHGPLTADKTSYGSDRAHRVLGGGHAVIRTDPKSRVQARVPARPRPDAGPCARPGPAWRQGGRPAAQARERRPKTRRGGRATGAARPDA